MGMSLKRAGFGALVIAAVLLPMRKPHRNAMVETASAPEDSLDELAWAYRRAAFNWSALSVRDTVIARAASLAPNSAPVVRLAGFSSSDSAPQAIGDLRRIWRRVRVADTNVRIGLLVYQPASRAGYGYSGARVVLDSAAPSCVAMVPGWRDVVTHGIRASTRDMSAAIAPCAMIATFGLPGPSVRAWLTRNRFAQARSNDWLLPSSPPHVTGPWAYWYDLQEVRDYPVWLERSALLFDAAAEVPRYEFGAAGLRCLSGDEASCVTSILRPDIFVEPAALVPADLTSDGESEMPRVVTVTQVRAARGDYLASLIQYFGRDRFRRFWVSPLPFEEAFQDAFGRSLGSWTREWAQTEWKETEYAHALGPDVVLGANVRPIEGTTMVLLWSVIGVASAGAFVTRWRS